MAKLSAGYIHMYLLRILIGPSVFPALSIGYMYLRRILIGPSAFPALSSGYMYLLRILIGPLVFPSLSTDYMYHYLWLDLTMNLLEKVFDLVSASDRLYHIPMLCRLKICFFLVRCQLSPLSSFASQTETPSSFEVFLFLHLVCKQSGRIKKTYLKQLGESLRIKYKTSKGVIIYGLIAPPGFE